MRKIQFGNEIVLKNERSNGKVVLRYYLLETPVGFGYGQLKSYGIGITRTDKIYGKPDISECKQIEGILFDIEEALYYIGKIKKEKVLPTQLSNTLESLIDERVKMQRELYLKEARVN